MMIRHDYAELLFTIENFLTISECEHWIRWAEATGFQPAAVKLASGPQMLTDVRNNDRLKFVEEALAAELHQRCQPFLPDHIEGGTPHSLDSHFRIYRYTPSQRFTRHRDGTVISEPRLRSRLSFLVYLNEGSVVGETVFYSHEKINQKRPEIARIIPKAGTALLFLHEWVHEGTLVSEGKKYVLRSDVFYQF